MLTPNEPARCGLIYRRDCYERFNNSPSVAPARQSDRMDFRVFPFLASAAVLVCAACVLLGVGRIPFDVPARALSAGDSVSLWADCPSCPGEQARLISPGEAPIPGRFAGSTDGVALRFYPHRAADLAHLPQDRALELTVALPPRPLVPALASALRLSAWPTEEGRAARREDR